MVPAELTFAVPAGRRAKSAHGIFEAALASPANDDKTDLAAFALPHGSSAVTALRTSIQKAAHVERTVAGRKALAARASATTGEKDEKDGLLAVVDGDARRRAIIVMANGRSAASERLLDAFLASASASAPPARPRSSVVVDRTKEPERFDAFVRARCAGMGLDLATAVNGWSAAATLPRGTAIRCVRAE